MTASTLTRQCLVPVDAFCECRHAGKINYPYYIIPHQQRRLWFGRNAGRVAEYQNRRVEGDFFDLYHESTPLIVRIHSMTKRMPVTKRQEDEANWLLRNLDRKAVGSPPWPCGANQMLVHTVSRLISTRRANTSVTEVIKGFTHEEPDQ